mgnify:CR=1 FL=1
MKKLFSILLVVLLTTAMSVSAFAATYSTPADACAGVTGKTLEQVITLRQGGKTYGAIAADAGKLEEFKDAVLEIKEDRLKKLVQDGTITQAEADEILEIIKERQAVCDGTGNGGSGLGLGLGGGRGRTQGTGRGNGGTGRGMGAGGMRLQDGSCYR